MQDIYAFDTEIGRYYQVGERSYPSVSTIINHTKSAKEKAILNNWRKRVGYKEASTITKNACNRGTLLHNAVEYLIDGDIDAFNRLGTHDAIIDFIKPSVNIFSYLTQCTTLGKEEIVANHQLKYAGRYDYYTYSPKSQKRVLVDWKTSNKPKLYEYCNNYFLQLTAYSLAIEATTGKSPDELAVIVFYENNPADIYRVSTDSEEFATFKSELCDKINLFFTLFPG